LTKSQLNLDKYNIIEPEEIQTAGYNGSMELHKP